MEGFFTPGSIAVIGASREEGKVGHQILKNILNNGFEGKIYPVNPNADEILGLKCYKSIMDVPEADLGIIAVPAEKVPEVLEDCGKKGVKSVIIVSSGFKEAGRKDLEDKIVLIAKKYRIRVIGPNVFGIVYTPSNLNATFGPEHVVKGKIALVTQSGALGVALMGWTAVKKIGLSAVVSLGNKADVDEADVIEYLGKDEETKVIVCYIEGLENGRKFMDTVRRCGKPIVAIKAGRTASGSSAASTHTGALAGDDVVYSGAFKQVGVIRAEDVEEAFVFSKVLLSEKIPENESVIIITNGGGVGVMASDFCEQEGIPLYKREDLVAFKKVVPPFGAWKNPIDLTGQARAEDYKNALEVAEKTKAGSVIVLFCETAVCPPEEMVGVFKKVSKPVVFAGVGGERTEKLVNALGEVGVPAYDFPSKAVKAVKALNLWAKYREKRLENVTNP